MSDDFSQPECIAQWLNSKGWSDEVTQNASQAISKYFEDLGFLDIERVGAGSFALVVRPKDNPDIVFRLDNTLSVEGREEMPCLLQPIDTKRIKAQAPEGELSKFLSIEVLRYVDVDSVTQSEMQAFVDEVSSHGYDIGSLARGKEIGLDGQKLVAVDPSAVEGYLDNHDIYQLSDIYPSLAEQAQSNLDIARKDERLASFIPDLEEKFERYASNEQSDAVDVSNRLKGQNNAVLRGTIVSQGQQADIYP